MSYEHTVIVGNLGRDPELRYTPNGKAVTNFSVAVSRRYTGKDGESHEKTKWFRITAWDKLAELCNEHLTKGRQVLVEGEIEASAYAAPDGEPKASLELTARNVRFLGAKGDPAPATASTEAAMPF